jgi:hypothetical protein
MKSEEKNIYVCFSITCNFHEQIVYCYVVLFL